MKTYEEKTQNVFSRIEKEKKIQMKRRKNITKVSVSVLSFCFVAVIGYGVWQLGVLRQKPSIAEDINTDNLSESELVKNNSDTVIEEELPSISETDVELPDENSEAWESSKSNPNTDGSVEREPPEIETENDEIKISATGDIDDICITVDSGFTEWNNKTVSLELAEKLKSSSEYEIFYISANPYIDYDFVYENKTLAEYYSDMCDERNLPEILMQLLKEGDSLKYGTKLYEEGDSEGVKWDKNFYEERILFYGEKILNNYIVDGEFLIDELQNDIVDAQKAKEATIAYKAAFTAYYRYLADTLQVTVTPDVKGTTGIILQMTADEFKNFTADNIEAWTFKLENGNGDDGFVIEATDN